LFKDLVLNTKCMIFIVKLIDYIYYNH